MSWVAFERSKVLEVAGVGQLVEVHHRIGFPSDLIEDKVRADESGAAGHEDGVVHGLEIMNGSGDGNKCGSPPPGVHRTILGRRLRSGLCGRDMSVELHSPV